MRNQLVDKLEDLLVAGPDTALLRFSLGNAYLKNNPKAAVTHLSRAVALDPRYTAAWKVLGKALSLEGDTISAIAAYQQGIEIAQENGDKQAAKEMSVFIKRLRKSSV